MEIHRIAPFVLLLSTIATAAPLRAREDPGLSVILERMVAHKEWQDGYLSEYTAVRTFYAENDRFGIDATLVVETVFQEPEVAHSRIVRQEGSSLIRERVFDKILEAERETHSGAAKRDTDITPANYTFRWIGSEMCETRACYRLGIESKRKDRYSMEGDVWVDTEDFAIVRVKGSPSKRPSFWTTKTDIDRRYRRVDGIWLTDRIESNSELFVAGKSYLKIDYNYTTIKTGR